MANPVGDLRIKTDDGTFIAASQRADGTWRKPRKVKEGFVPQDEQPKYESRGQQATKNRRIPGLTPMAIASQLASNKPIVAIEQPKACITPQEQIQKKIKKVQKKLDEVLELEKLRASGERLKPQQMPKLERKGEYQGKIDELEEELKKLDMGEKSEK